MFRINKQPLQTAVGTFTVLTAVLAFTGCSAGEKNTEETEPSSSEAVLYMGDDPVTEEELAALGQGGLCLNCPECTFPNCGFGKGR